MTEVPEDIEIEVTEPRLVPVLPLPEVVIFPNSISPLFATRPRSIAAVQSAAESTSNDLLMVTQRLAEEDDPKGDDLYEIGTVGKVLQHHQLPDNTMRIIVEGEEVVRVMDYVERDGVLWARVEPYLMYCSAEGKDLEAIRRVVLNQFETYANLSDKIPEDLYINITRIEDSLDLAHHIANYCAFKVADKQAILELVDVVDKLSHLSRIFSVENELLAMESKIINQVKSQIGRNQKEYFLNEQLKVIEKELGLGNEDDIELDELQKAIEESMMSEEARDKAERELGRLSRMAPMSPEYTVSRTYIEWLLDYPWGIVTQDSMDLRRAVRILNEDHYGLEKVKERIVEHLAVLRLVGDAELKGPILCLVGPPGVGKTSLARSVARTLDRKFVRFSLGGVRDEAEIRGHRRTYIGAMPGKLVQLVKKAGSCNPVVLLDEIDKMNSDFRGDPASALLEVLDPEQNHNFNDHYMEVDIDLSKILFITTANTTDGVPWALQDRMEILRLPGYTRDEKLEIARRYLVPRQKEANGLADRKVTIGDDAIETIIDHYTREAGVRNLEREIAAVCRKTARKIANARKARAIAVGPKDVRKHLGPIRHEDYTVEPEPEVGVAVGLAWTEVGGELLAVEVNIMPGKGKLELTGKLGDVMQESARAALSYIRARAKDLGIDPDFHQKHDIHIHLPEGAIPKDGPSAGVTMITALVSALSGRPVRQDVAMTGEITLRGKVLKIGGLKEKIIAAHRARIPRVIIPHDNADGLEDVAPKIRGEMKFRKVRTIDEVLRTALVSASKRRKASQKDEGGTGTKVATRKPRRRVPKQPGARVQTRRAGSGSEPLDT